MKLMPASSAAWMIRIESSWSVLPHSPNIIAPRQSGLTLTPVVPRLRSCMAPNLVDRCEAGLKSVARGAQVEPPHARALGAGQARGLIEVVVQAPRPVAQGFRVVVPEALDVAYLEAGSFEGEVDPRQVQRVGGGEDVALAEWTSFGVAVAEPCDAVVQQPSASRQQGAELRGVLVDPFFADVLDHADAGDRVELLAADLAVVLHSDVDLVADAGLFSMFARSSRLRLRQGDAGDVDVVLLGRVHDPAAPATADVENALPGLEIELGADQVQLRPLGLFQRGGAAAEDGAAVRQRLTQEELEELGWQVVVVANRALVAGDRVTAALRLELDRRRRRGERRPGGTNSRDKELGLILAVDRRRLPVANHVHRRIEIVDSDVARHVCASDAELAGRAHGMADRLA